MIRYICRVDPLCFNHVRNFL